MNLCTKYNVYHVSNVGFDGGALGAPPHPHLRCSRRSRRSRRFLSGKRNTDKQYKGEYDRQWSSFGIHRIP